MKVLISGASGLIGSALTTLLTTHGDRAIHLGRAAPQPGQAALRWNPEAGELPTPPLEGFDGVVHLAGESVASGRWTAARKERILRSRVAGTGLLCRGLAALDRPPPVLVCASAVGYYGDAGDRELTESSPAGEGFLAEVVSQWEAAAEPAREAGIRVVHLRFGTVLSPNGGALGRMLPPFRLGLGGRVGHGRQYWSWISLADAVAATRFCLVSDRVDGPVNAVAPEAATNAQFTASLGRALRRPTPFPLPAVVLKLFLGEMGQALLLSSARVRPDRLLEAGYGFIHKSLDTALADLLKPGAS